MPDMARFGSQGNGEWNMQNIGTGLLLVLGVGLVGYGSYIHLTIAARLRAGQCDGCAPWHPLFVLAPLLFGVAFVLMAGYLRIQQ